MKKNYNIIFEESPIDIIDVKGELPADCLYPLHSSDEAKLYQFTAANLLRQGANFEHYQIDCFELNSKKPFKIRYELYERRVFITFVVHNDIHFTTGTENTMLVAKELTHYISSEQKGIYGVNCSAGITVLVVIAVQPEWLVKAISGYPILTEAVRHMLETDSAFEILPDFAIDKQIRDWIFSVRNFRHENPVARDSFTATHIAMGLGNYEMLLAKSDNGKIYQIKLYIEQHFANPQLDLSELVSRFGFTKRTAVRKFKKIYGMSMRTFKTHVRITTAYTILKKEGISVAQVIERVGYNNINSFHKAARKFLNGKKS